MVDAASYVEWRLLFHHLHPLEGFLFKVLGSMFVDDEPSAAITKEVSGVVAGSGGLAEITLGCLASKVRLEWSEALDKASAEHSVGCDIGSQDGVEVVRREEGSKV